MDTTYRDVRYVAAESEEHAAVLVAVGRGRHTLAEALVDLESWRPLTAEVYAIELVVKRVSRETEGEKP